MTTLGEPLAPGRSSHFQWPAIFGGAIAGAGVSFTLHAFATGIGLSVLSTAPTWRDSTPVYWFLSGLYLLFVALCSFAVGGYVAGRMRAPLNIASPEMEFRDGMHGLVTWGLAVFMTAVLALGLAVTTTTALESSDGSAGGAQSVAGENVLASELDELFRTERTLPDLNYRRSEAARILLKSSGHNGVPSVDRDYLALITQKRTGLRLDDAQSRVEHAITASGQELRRARMAAVLQAFFVAAALFIGAAVAWFTACEGGRDREAGTIPIWDWSMRRRR
jgi:hypothetical protein